MKTINYIAVFLIMVGVTLAILLVNDVPPHERNARERGELQASFYTPKPDIIEGE